MGLFDRKDNAGIIPNASGRTCYDCKYYNDARSDKKSGMIYCDWDSEYYPPETGSGCDDFK